MFAVTKSIKFQNKLAKEAILNALKSKSASMFNEGMILRCFMNVTENSIEIFHVFKNKEYVNKTRSSWTNQFWQDIREMGGTVSGLEGECEVEYSSEINLEDFTKTNPESDPSVPDTVYQDDVVNYRFLIPITQLPYVAKFLQNAKAGKSVVANFMQSYAPIVIMIDDIVKAGPSYVNQLKQLHNRAKNETKGK